MVVVLSKPSCVQCNATYRSLDSKGIQYRIIDMTEDGTALEKAKSLGYAQAPVVIDESTGSHWSGFRPDKIDELALRVAA